MTDEGYSELIGDWVPDTEVDLVADRATKIAETAKAAVDMVTLGYAADLDDDDLMDFWAMVRELLPRS